MKYTLLLPLLFIFLSCEEIAPPKEFDEPEAISNEIKGFCYQLDPYHEFLDDIPEMLIYIQGDKFMIEQKAAVGEIGGIPWAYEILAVDTIFFPDEEELTSLGGKIRYTVQDIENGPSFTKHQYTFEVYNGFFIVDNSYIYCTRKGANKAIELIDKGIISDRYPYHYTMKGLEKLDSVASRFHTTQEMLLKWNPQLKYGYTIGSIVKIHWVPTELK